jgi:hypothetical protein
LAVYIFYVVWNKADSQIDLRVPFHKQFKKMQEHKGADVGGETVLILYTAFTLHAILHNWKFKKVACDRALKTKSENSSGLFVSWLDLDSTTRQFIWNEILLI